MWIITEYNSGQNFHMNLFLPDSSCTIFDFLVLYHMYYCINFILLKPKENQSTYNRLNSTLLLSPVA